MKMGFESEGAEAVSIGEQLAAMTERALMSAVTDLDGLMVKLKEGQISEVKDANAAIRNLQAAFQRAIAEREKVEQLRREIAGGVGDHELDLQSARDEIGRRLALLRNAGGD